MATEVEKLVVKLEADIAKFRTDMGKAGNATEKFAKKGKKSVNKLSKAFKDAGTSIAAIQGPLGPIAGRVSAMGAAFARVNPLMVVAGIAIAGVVFAMKDAIKAGAALESQMFKLEALVKATGTAAQMSAGEINEFAMGLGEATLTSAGAVRDAAGVLLTFKSISGDVFKDTLRLAQDMSSVGFGNLKSSTLQLAKALEEPTIGLTMLRRSGVMFTAQQQEMIKGLVETGNLLQAQKMILNEVNSQVGGAAVAAAQGMAGAWDTLGERITRVLENVSTGTGLLGSLTAAVNWFSDSVADQLVGIEGAAKAQRLWNEQILPNVDAFTALGFSINSIDPTSLQQVERLIGDISARGISLKNDLELNTLQAEFMSVSIAVHNAEKSMSVLAKHGMEGSASFKQQSDIVAKLTPQIDALSAKFLNIGKAEYDAAQATKELNVEFAKAEAQDAANVKSSDEREKRLDKLIEQSNPFSEAVKKQADAIKFLTDQVDSGALKLGVFQEMMAGMSFEHPDLEGGGGGPSDEDTAKANESMVNMIANRKARLDESLMSENERLQAHYEEQQGIIIAAEAIQIIDEETANAQLEDLEKTHQANMLDILSDGKIKMKKFDKKDKVDQLNATSQFFASTIGSIKSHGKVAFAIWKVAAISKGLIDLKSTVMSAFKTGTATGIPGAGIAYAAAAGAAQLSNLNQIRQATFGGGGGGGGSAGGGGGGGGGETQVTQPDAPGRANISTVVSINLGDEDTMISSSGVRRLIDSINDAIDDGATIRGIEVTGGGG